MIATMQAGDLGYIDTPAQGNRRPPGVKFCMDNGAFSDNFNEAKWWRFLTDNAYAAGDCLFAVAPDVVGDAAATLERSLPWLPKIRALGYPAAFVAQDGLEHLDVPWDDFDCLFIGGSTEWKLSRHAIELAHQAKLRGKAVHCGRVNSERRFRWASAPYPYGLGADSADGTFLTFGPDVNLPKLMSWLRGSDQMALFAGMDEKVCSRCHVPKQPIKFASDASRADGTSKWCKACTEGYRKTWQAENRERINAQAREWRQQNPELTTEIERRWRDANRDKVRAKGKRRYDRRRALEPEVLRLEGSERQQVRRARLAGVPSESVDRVAVFERDGWVCQLCGNPVDPGIDWPDPLSRSLDHRIPISRGGGHTYDNTQLAHLVCNQAKGGGEDA